MIADGIVAARDRDEILGRVAVAEVLRDERLEELSLQRIGVELDDDGAPARGRVGDHRHRAGR